MVRLVFCLTALCGLAFGQETVSIERYGLNGDLTPTVMGKAMPDIFFSTHRTASLTSDRNYISSFNLPGILSSQEGERSEVAMELIVGNESRIPADVVVSATKRNSNQIRNFIVRVPYGEAIILDVSGLREFDQLYLVSMNAFRAWMEQYDGKSLMAGEELTVKTPVVDLVEEAFNDAPFRSTNYCQSLTGALRFIKAETAVAAYFDRQPFPLSSISYTMNVYYPTHNDLFHVWHNSGTGTGMAQCEMRYYTTKQAATQRLNLWRNMDNVLLGWENGWACADTDLWIYCDYEDRDYIILRIF